MVKMRLKRAVACVLLTGLSTGAIGITYAAEVMVAQANNGTPDGAPSDLEGGLPIIRLGDRLIAEINAALNAKLPGEEAAYFMAIRPNGDSIILDKIKATWIHLDDYEKQETLLPSVLRNISPEVNLRIDDTYLRCAAELKSNQPNCRIKVAQTSDGQPDGAPDDLEGALPIVRLDGPLIVEMNNAIQAKLPGEEAAYFVAVRPNGDSVILDRGNANWKLLEKEEELRKIAPGILYFDRPSLSFRVGNFLLRVAFKFNQPPCHKARETLNF